MGGWGKRNCFFFPFPFEPRGLPRSKRFNPPLPGPARVHFFFQKIFIFLPFIVFHERVSGECCVFPLVSVFSKLPSPLSPARSMSFTWARCLRSR